MTTHYEKIQALGNRMANNLETMGVSASFSDGGLTLADKILQIQRFTDGLLLYADEKVIQTGDTVNLYALLLQDGKTVSGETIKFDFGTNVYSKQVSLSDDLYDDYYVESSKTGSNYDSIGTGHSGYIQFNSSTIKTYVTSFSPEVTYNGEPFHIKDGVLTYKDTSDVERTIDVSAIDTSKAYGGASFTIHYHWIEATTGSDSVATVSYTGVGVGKLNVQAKTIDGSVQSEIYTVLDCMFYDEGTGSTPNSHYYETGNITISSDNTGTLFNRATTGTNYVLIDKGTPGTWNDAFDWTGEWVFEADIVETTGNPILLLNEQNNMGTQQQLFIAYNPDGFHLKVVYDGSTVRRYADGVEFGSSVPSVSFTNPIQIGFVMGGTVSIKMKNVKIYPI